MTDHTTPTANWSGRFASTGEGEAFDELVRRHSALVLRVCHRITGSAHEAEDAAQAVFVAFAERAGELTAHRSVAGWLYSTAWHIAARARRDSSRRARRERAAAAERAVMQATTDLECDEARLELYRAIEMLPPDYRCAIVMHHLEGFPIDQIAAMLDTPSGTVSARLSRGRALLRQRLAARGTTLGSMLLAEILEQERTRLAEVVPFSFRKDVSEKFAALSLGRRMGTTSGRACVLAATAKVATSSGASGWLDACARCLAVALKGHFAKVLASVVVLSVASSAPGALRLFTKVRGTVAAFSQNGARPVRTEVAPRDEKHGQAQTTIPAQVPAGPQWTPSRGSGPGVPEPAAALLIGAALAGAVWRRPQRTLHRIEPNGR